jgi:hypothetical protein
MGQHADLGLDLLRLAAGSQFRDSGPSVRIDFGPDAGTATIDGTVADCVAVEIESREPKQVRGAILDLLLHSFPKKLLVLLPAYTRATTPAQARAIMARFLEADAFRVVAVTKDPDETIGLLRVALTELGVLMPANEPDSATSE